MQKISQKSDDLFTIRDYLLDDGALAIGSWYERQNEEIQADFHVLLNTLRKMPRPYWRKTRFQELGRRQTVCQGLVRLRVWIDADDERTHFRILGYLGPGDHDLTMLMVFKKDDDPDYSLSCPEARDRKVKVENEPTRSRECSL